MLSSLFYTKVDYMNACYPIIQIKCFKAFFSVLKNTVYINHARLNHHFAFRHTRKSHTNNKLLHLSVSDITFVISF